MRPAVYQVKDLFKEILINENGIDEMCLPDLLDIRGLCWHIIDLVDEREMKQYTNGRERRADEDID